MATVVIRPDDNVLAITVHDRLAEDDYQRFVKQIARLTGSCEKIHVLFEPIGPCGWTGGALWDEVAFDPACFERVAVVSDRECDKAMEVFCRALRFSSISKNPVFPILKKRDKFRSDGPFGRRCPAGAGFSPPLQE